MRLFIYLLFLVGFSGLARAQEVIDLDLLEKAPTSASADPKSFLINQAIEKVSKENIQAFIGAEKMKANETKIKEKVIAQSSKYILSQRTGQLQKEAGQFTLALQLKVSLKNLRALLLTEGLLYQTEGSPSIIPVVRISDQVALQSYSWWDPSSSSASGFAKGAFEILLSKLGEDLKSTNFQLKKPDAEKLKPKYGGDKLSVAEAISLAESYKASVLLRGEITFSQKEKRGRYTIHVHLTAFQTLNGRIMADVIREYETEPGSYRNVIVPKFVEIAPQVASALSVQLEDAWNKGTFGTRQLKLLVSSDLSPMQMEAFKKTLLIKIRDIKGIRERIIGSRSFVYDIDTQSTTQQLAQSLKTQKLPSFKVEVSEVDNDQIQLELSTL